MTGEQFEEELYRENLYFVYEDKCKELEKEIERLKDVIKNTTEELFTLKDMIYKPETREENFEIQRKISSIIKKLNGKGSDKECK